MITNKLPDPGFAPVGSLFPTVSPPVVAAFKKLEREEAKNSEAFSMFSDDSIAFLCADEERPEEFSLRQNSAIAALQQLPTSRPHNERWLRSVNGLLRGLNGPADYRTNACWIGHVAAHRSMWVGSPPALIYRLMRNWELLSNAGYPTSLQIALGSQRLLQVHPFEDANARVSRWYSLSMIHTQLGGNRSIFERMQRYWKLSALERVQIALTTDKGDGWNRLFDVWLN